MNFGKWYKYGNELLEEMSNTKIAEESVAIWFFGQAGVAIKADGVTVYIDPFFSESYNVEGVSKRSFPPPFEPTAVKNADYVLCTHNHSDHLSLDTLKGIAVASPKAKFIVPAPYKSVLENVGISDARIISAYEGQELSFSRCRVIPNGCPHDKFETDENGNHLYMGYFLEMNGVNIYHSGDTVEWPEMCDMLMRLKIDVIMLPINGSDWKRKSRGLIGNLNPREAADVAVGCGADLVIPMHFDLFDYNGENPAHFAHYMYSFYPNKKFHIMTRGERFIYVK